MHATSLARAAYAADTQPLRTPRGTEFDLFAQITRRLRDAAAGGRAGFPALAAALHDNRRLWTVLAADVASEGNALPEGLRAQLFYLAEFTAHQSDRILAGEAAPDILVEINTAVLRGLGGPGGTA